MVGMQWGWSSLPGGRRKERGVNKDFIEEMTGVSSEDEEKQEQREWKRN